MDKRIEKLFVGELGSKIYSKAVGAVVSYGMDTMLKQGVLVGLSGGADSVMLLAFLCEYRRRNGYFNIVACHLNHMIRGESALRDESFSEGLCATLDIPFVSVSKDIPKIAEQKRLGVEETARNERYSFFTDIISGRGDLFCVATAHNLSDLAETVIFNISRGASIGGLGGIPPVRDNIVRPLIDVSSRDIRMALDDAGVSYVVDETNLSDEYTRNYIRHDIAPKLERINSSYESALGRMSRAARCVDDYISGVAESFILERGNLFGICELRELHSAVLGYVLSLASCKFIGASLEDVHISAITNLVHKDNFEVSLPNNSRFVCERGVCRFVIGEKEDNKDTVFMLSDGENKIDGFALSVCVGPAEEKISSNVYKFSIHLDIPSDIICGRLYLRFKRDGDAYRYSGHTHKLKKVFNDRNIPSSERDLIPVICDDRGILWVPGLPVRESGESHSTKMIRIILNYEEPKKDKKAVYTACLRK